MNQLFVILAASWVAGLAGFAGGVAAMFEGSTETEAKREFIHGIVAFGGGILLAAVAFALVPEGIKFLNPVLLLGTFCAGGILFCVLDSRLARNGGSSAQFMAMLMDFLPESISIGAVFVHDSRLGFLLAIFIGAQNLPEGFNSFRELAARGVNARKALLALFASSLLGPLAACAGYFLLQDLPSITAGIMTFAAGGILYLVFQDIAPQSSMRRHWTPPLGAVAGFAVGMIGKKLLG